MSTGNSKKDDQEKKNGASSSSPPSVLLTGPPTTARASSVLQKNSKVNGPKNALDYQNTSSSWNSEGSMAGATEGSDKATYFVVDFGRVVEPKELRLQFQAGFAAEEIHVSLQDEVNSSKWKPMVELEAEDDHDMQTFSLLEDCKNKGKTKALKFEFQEATDFYNRITIYQLQVWGNEAEPEN